MEIATAYPSKSITLVHSRDYLFPDISQYTTAPHDYALNAMRNRGVTVILADKIVSFEYTSRSPYGKTEDEGTRMGLFRTEKGRDITVDVAYLCMGYVSSDFAFLIIFSTPTLLVMMINSSE